MYEMFMKPRKVQYGAHGQKAYARGAMNFQ